MRTSSKAQAADPFVFSQSCASTESHGIGRAAIPRDTEHEIEVRGKLSVVWQRHHCWSRHHSAPGAVRACTVRSRNRPAKTGTTAGDTPAHVTSKTSGKRMRGALCNRSSRPLPLASAHWAKQTKPMVRTKQHVRLVLRRYCRSAYVAFRSSARGSTGTSSTAAAASVPRPHYPAYGIPARKHARRAVAPA
jgi:hypothetical protein